MCFACVEVVVRLLDRLHVLDLGEPRDRLGLDVDHDAAGDVVDDDRLVGRRRHGLEVRHDPALRRLRVVGRHDQAGVDAELVRPLGQVDRVARVVGAGAGDDGRAVADLLQRGGEELEALVVRERRRLPGRAGDDEAVGAVVDEMARQRPEALQVDGAVPLERRHDRCQNLAQHLRNHTFAAYSARAAAAEDGPMRFILILLLPALFAGHAATASNAVPSGPAGSARAQ